MKKLVLVCALVVAGFVLYKVALNTPYRRGVKFFSQGDYETAAEAFKESLEEGNQRCLSLVYLGRIEGINGRYRQGAHFCDEALEVQPDKAECHYFRAVLLQMAGEGRRAEEALDRLAELPQVGRGFAIGGLGGFARSGKLTGPEKVDRLCILQGASSPHFCPALRQIIEEHPELAKHFGG